MGTKYMILRIFVAVAIFEISGESKTRRKMIFCGLTNSVLIWTSWHKEFANWIFHNQSRRAFQALPGLGNLVKNFVSKSKNLTKIKKKTVNLPTPELCCCFFATHNNDTDSGFGIIVIKLISTSFFKKNRIEYFEI